jgi:hypothetical protein
MDTPAPGASNPNPAAPSGLQAESQIRAWLRLRRELSELHAQLEYLRLMVSLGVRRSRNG